MNDNYLWDKSGSPDPELERLEALLQPLREPGRFQEPATRRSRSRMRALWISVGLAAGIALALFGWTRVAAAPTWKVAALTGHIASQQLGTGDWFETSHGSRAQLQLDSFGQLEIEPGSRLHILRSAEDQQQFALEHGKMHATIWSPPGQFSVATSSTTAVDLGCMYTLETDAQGYGLVHVEAGWVALESHGHESLIPAGAFSRTSPQWGPGIPWFASASPELKALIETVDHGPASSASLLSALQTAGPEDTATLWHLLRRTPTEERGPIFDRLAALTPIPQGVTRAGILVQDPRMLEQLWDSLGYGETALWRKWKSRNNLR